MVLAFMLAFMLFGFFPIGVEWLVGAGNGWDRLPWYCLRWVIWGEHQRAHQLAWQGGVGHRENLCSRAGAQSWHAPRLCEQAWGQQLPRQWKSLRWRRSDELWIVQAKLQGQSNA